jgi:ATP-dependent helicase/nuclease subunit A
MLEMVTENLSLTELYKTFSELDFGRMSAKRSDVCLPEKREMVKQQRNEIKKTLQGIQMNFFFAPPKVQWKQTQKMSGKLLELIRLTEGFLLRFTEKKREKSLVDFHDLEQLALEILIKWDDETGKPIRTEAAAELAQQYKEIMIDEYQDSNLIQENILWAVSGVENDNPNIFMVGDIKQSIYRFREAKPELFTTKMEQYSKKNGKYRRVDLHTNFRSREIVVKSVNRIFRDIMKKDMGGIDYDEDAMLTAGGDFPDCEFPVSETTEVLVINGRDSDFEYEAKVIADKIKELTDKEKGIYIYENGKDGKGYYRCAQYRDIVILGRSVMKMIPTFERILNAEGIAVSAKKSEGFYETKEVSMMVNMLRVLDNPRQDIPLVALLRSGIFRFSDEELVSVKGQAKHKDFFDYLLEYQKEDELKIKIDRFLALILELRKKLSYANVSHIIRDIYERTSIYEVVMTMPGGTGRGANLDLLMQKAIDFDGTVYRGLFQFVRYLERIKTSETDEGEAVLTGENDNVVRIMTIHASKGLEYPICILTGMGKRLGGSKSQWLYKHSELGIGTEAVDNEARTRTPTLTKNFISRFNHLEDMGEELRVLYVAMTRAKEKIIFTGSERSLENKKSKWIAAGNSYYERSQNTTFFDFIMPTVLQSDEDIFVLHEYSEDDIIEREVWTELESNYNSGILNNFDTSVIYHEEVAKVLNLMDHFTYTSSTESLPVKVSVSDIKKQSEEEEIEEVVSLYDKNHEDSEMPIPGFALSDEEKKKSSAGSQGASYGTIWHQCMAFIDFTAIHTENDVKNEIEKLIREGKLSSGDEKVLHTAKLYRFFRSKLGQEMTEAIKKGQCRREQPFVMGVPVREVYHDNPSDETILVQGMIDAYYETEEGLVLIEYKTDHSKAGDEELLIRRYRTQIHFYKKALESIIGITVTRSYIYSFSLNKYLMV